VIPWLRNLCPVTILSIGLPFAVLMSYFCSFPLFHDSESLSSVSIRVFSRARDLLFLPVETLTYYPLLYIYLLTSWGIHMCFDFRRSCLQESYWRTRFQRIFLSNTSTYRKLSVQQCCLSVPLTHGTVAAKRRVVSIIYRVFWPGEFMHR
jgi:hypothetical protein